MLGTVLTEELNVEEEKAANVTSVDFRNQEASTVGHQIKGDVGKRQENAFCGSVI